MFSEFFQHAMSDSEQGIVKKIFRRDFHGS